MAFETIQTKRLVLTPITVEDAVEMSSVLGDLDLYVFTGGAPDTAEHLAVRYARWAAGASRPDQTWLNLIVRERASRCAVGYVQATINPQATDIAWVIGTRWQRKGYATEATLAMVASLSLELHVRTFRALIRSDHTASHRVAARLGLERTNEEVDGEQVWLVQAPFGSQLPEG